jgi:hypothetical protein
VGRLGNLAGTTDMVGTPKSKKIKFPSQPPQRKDSALFGAC